MVVSFLLVLCLLAVPVSAMAESNSPSQSSGNDYPIVLVHGLTGWGKNEMLGYKYWGGLRDIEGNLNNNGHPRETFNNYMNRVMSSPVWTSNDISAHDLTTYGAQELNSWVKTSPNVYYFSHVGNATYRGILTGYYYPMITMNPLMMGSSKLMGSYTRKSKEPVIDKTWFPNDGLVNVVSAKYPMGQANQPYNGEVEKGVWNTLPTMEGWDHIDYIGILGANTPGYSNIYGYYHKIADQLLGLPKDSK